MFLPIIIIVFGAVVLLNAMGILSGSFWGFFWGILLILLGLKLLMRRGKCPICGWHNWEGKIHNKMHDKMGGRCCGGHEEHSREE